MLCSNKEDVMKLLITVYRKSTNTSIFSLIIFVGISEIREAFLDSKSKIYFSMSCVITSAKENSFLPLYLG